jgi:hypothetical protein
MKRPPYRALRELTFARAVSVVKVSTEARRLVLTWSTQTLLAQAWPRRLTSSAELKHVKRVGETVSGATRSGSCDTT